MVNMYTYDVQMCHFKHHTSLIEGHCQILLKWFRLPMLIVECNKDGSGDDDTLKSADFVVFEFVG